LHRGIAPKENTMKKTIIATLLILALTTTALFAVTDNFNVTTTVAEVGLIKITTASIGTTHSVSAFNALTDFTTLAINSSGSQDFTAYMTTLSNKRSGYTVKMVASAMTSTVGSATSYIDYTVGCNSLTATTNGATGSSEITVLTVPSLSAITGSSKAITLSVDATTFEAAVAGSYTGTVTFTYTAN